MSAEGFMFNKRFAEALAELPAEEYKRVMVAVANYAMEGIIPEGLSGAEKAIFLLMKPQIDISEKRRESGRKGGEAKQSNAEANSSKEEANASKDVANSSKVVANCSKVEAEREREKEKVTQKEKDKDKDLIKKDTPKGVSKEKASAEATPKHKRGEFGNVLLTDDEVEKLKTDYGEQKTSAAIAFLDEYIQMKGYKAKSHYLALRKWVFDAVKEKEIKQNELKKREDKVIESIKRNRFHNLEEHGTDYEALLWG